MLGGDQEWCEIQTKLKLAEEKSQHGEVGALYEALDSIDGYTTVSRAEQLMAGLGFATAEFSEPLSAFSGVGASGSTLRGH